MFMIAQSREEFPPGQHLETEKGRVQGKLRPVQLAANIASSQKETGRGMLKEQFEDKLQRVCILVLFIDPIASTL
jgi:hypothetical protein